VPRFIAYGEHEGRRYMLMEYMDMNLDQYLAVKTGNDPNMR